MATWLPISGSVIQRIKSDGKPANGYVLKLYAAGTTDNIPMATDAAGSATANTALFSSTGDVTVSGSTIIPHIDQDYKYVIYPNQAAADSDTGATLTIDNVPYNRELEYLSVNYLTGVSDSLASNVPASVAVGDLAQVNRYSSATPASLARWECTSITASLPAGATVGDVTGSALGVLYVLKAGSTYYKFELVGEVNVFAFGAIGDGSSDDSAAIQAAIDSVSNSGGQIKFPENIFAIASTLTIINPDIFLDGSVPGAQNGDCSIKYIGSQSDTARMIDVETTAHNFSIRNFFLDANDKAGFCLYMQGDNTPALTRGGLVQSIAFQGYRDTAWVLGDDTDTLNAAQFQIINAYDIVLTGGADSTNSNGIHVNAQNMEFLNIYGLYIDPSSGNNRYHTNHIRQIAGAVNIHGMLSTRAGTSTLTADYAIHTRDQLIIHGWRSEDRLLITGTAVAVPGPVIINGVHQRDISATTGTDGADQVIQLNQTTGLVSLNGIIVQGSIAIGATTARNVSAMNVLFDDSNQVGTSGDYVFSGPQNQSGLFHDFASGLLKIRGASVGFASYDADGTENWRCEDGSLFATRTNVAQITSDQAAWNVGNGFLLNISSDAARNVNGVVNTAGRMVRLFNTGSFTITLKHESGAASQSSYRIFSLTGADIALAPDEFVEMHWNTSKGRWISWKL